jgi:predicted DNA-binding transcriptional regulator AlpA
MSDAIRPDGPSSAADPSQLQPDHTRLSGTLADHTRLVRENLVLLGFAVPEGAESSANVPIFAWPRETIARKLRAFLKEHGCPDEELPRPVQIGASKDELEWAEDYLLRHRLAELPAKPSDCPARPSPKPPAADLAPSHAAERQATDKRQRRGGAAIKLSATLDSLVAKREWCKTDTEILKAAGISRDSFYRLVNPDKGTPEIARKLCEYRRQTAGRGPVRLNEM